jgi:hypothetical protein
MNIKSNLENFENLKNHENLENFENLENTRNPKNLENSGNPIKCENCGEIIDPDDIYWGLENERLCEDCYNEIYSNCEECGQICYREEMEIGLDGEMLCTDCYYETYAACNDCGNISRISNMYEYSGSLICERCFYENYFICSYCEEVCNINEACEDPNGDVICEDCFNDHCFVCDACGNTFFDGDYGGDGMCIDCYNEEAEEEDDSDIENHEPEFYPEIPLATPEIECEGGNLLYVDDFSDGIINGIVKDGSLCDGGREFHPRPLKIEEEDIFEILKTITDKLDDYGWEATPRCGCHVHFNANYMNETEVIQIWKSYLSLQPYLDLIVDNSRINNYTCSPLRKSDIKRKKTLDEMIYKTRNEWVINDKKSEKYAQERYAAVNFHSYNYRNTIEVRLLEGTLDPEVIANWIYINNNIMQYTRKFGNPKGIITFNKFLDIAANGNNNLKNYIIKRTGKNLTENNGKETVKRKRNIVEINLENNNKLIFTEKNLRDLYNLHNLEISGESI